MTPAIYHRVMLARRREALWTKACFLEDEESKRSQREAVRLIRQAIAMGERQALGSLAHAYDSGRGVKSSRKMALRLWRRDWRGGSAIAARNIALVLRDEGRITSAIKWLHRAIAHNDPDARLDLAVLLLDEFKQSSHAVNLLEEFVAPGPQKLVEIRSREKPIDIEDERYLEGVRILRELKGQTVE